jgi:hypothetical protein
MSPVERNTIDECCKILAEIEHQVFMTTIDDIYEGVLTDRLSNDIKAVKDRLKDLIKPRQRHLATILNEGIL